MECEWIVNTKLEGDFRISRQNPLKGSPMVDELRVLRMRPEFREGKWTGMHEVEAVLLFPDCDGETVEARTIYERVVYVIESIASLATLGCGRAVSVAGGIHAKHLLSDRPKKYRLLTRPDAHSRHSPLHIPAELLTVPIPRSVARIIRWWARGINASDEVDQLVSPNNALDLLSGMTDSAPPRIRKCRKCGTEEEIGPGQRERVIAYLTGSGACDAEMASKTYESRLDLAHARTDLNEKDLFKYRCIRDTLATVLRDGIAEMLGLELQPVPDSFPFDLPSAVLDVVYTESEPPQHSISD